MGTKLLGETRDLWFTRRASSCYVLYLNGHSHVTALDVTSASCWIDCRPKGTEGKYLATCPFRQIYEKPGRKGYGRSPFDKSNLVNVSDKELALWKDKTQAYNSTYLYTVFGASTNSKVKAAFVANDSKPSKIESIAGKAKKGFYLQDRSGQR